MGNTAEVFIQWKGTDVCFDFTCPCGSDGHFDGFFAYFVKCRECGQTFEMPHTFQITPIKSDPRMEPVIPND